MKYYAQAVVGIFLLYFVFLVLPITLILLSLWALKSLVIAFPLLIFCVVSTFLIQKL